MKVTERGLHVIKQWERFRPKAYKDGIKVLSIGFGHSNILSTPVFDELSVWTEQYAHDVLLADLDYFGGLLAPHLKIKVPDTLWSVLMSLSMNKGVGRLVRSDEWKILHNVSDPYHKEAFCEAILKYAVAAPNKVTEVMEEKKGLRWRRIAEAGLYLQDRQEGYL